MSLQKQQFGNQSTSTIFFLVSFPANISRENKKTWKLYSESTDWPKNFKTASHYISLLFPNQVPQQNIKISSRKVKISPNSEIQNISSMNCGSLLTVREATSSLLHVSPVTTKSGYILMVSNSWFTWNPHWQVSKKLPRLRPSINFTFSCDYENGFFEGYRVDFRTHPRARKKATVTVGHFCSVIAPTKRWCPWTMARQHLEVNLPKKGNKSKLNGHPIRDFRKQ